jgi:hypothetical protein
MPHFLREDLGRALEEEAGFGEVESVEIAVTDNAQLAEVVEVRVQILGERDFPDGGEFAAWAEKCLELGRRHRRALGGSSGVVKRH